ncbi:NosR/NirI family protein [Sulfuriflexus mobilis]|uniref:NosR/NirI family protein n=1 Tax=Sulfuriflexus mobilis TaxID=1811807 RepID=UPI000F83051F|nr:NosR/NirI family protein [Sulfuriflexus mobilis]
MKEYLHKVRNLAIIFILLIVSGQVAAAGIQDHFPLIQKFFPEADGVGDLEGQPASAAVLKGSNVLGYVYYTDDVIKIPAYSGKPIRTLVGFDIEGKIVGLKIVHHEEPILVVGISDADLQAFIDQYLNKYVNDKIKVGGRDRDGYKSIDSISGATITVMVLNATINQSMRKVAEARGLLSLDGEILAQTKAFDEEPIWIYVWRGKVFQISVLILGLAVLMLILVMQDWIAQHPTFLIYLRTGFLIYTVVFIGWYSLAQLSIVNIFTFVNSFMHGFSWDNFLIDPMMFLLWGFVAVTVLLWGRGVYCGWLCPFGAMQELIFRITERCKCPTFEFPEVVHERLWAIKYIILLGLFAVSMQSLVMAEKLAEVEPFKTAVTLRFAREWSYVLYAAGLLLISAFNRKFYCRYVCPLGAALTFPSKFRIFEWLRRYKECGRPCQICRNECEVRAIRSTGEINANECHYCLDCQVTYWNAYKCPPLAEKRKKRERTSKLSESMQK